MRVSTVDWEALAAPIRREPATAHLVVDYDGTLSPIVSDPAEAIPAPGAVEVLELLASSYGEVTVVSGRPLSFLLDRVPDSVSMVGLYGLEGTRAGQRWEHPNGGAWREIIGDLALTAARIGPVGMLIESKDLSITLHYRTCPEIEADVRSFARLQAERSGLRAREAKMSMELQPPIDTDKGTVIDSICADAQSVLFAGDDVGDLPGFDALDRLAARGRHCVRLAVASDESPEALIERADLVVSSPAELVSLLSSL